MDKVELSLARKAYVHLEMKGYARVDMRLDPQRGPVFSEMNSNPDLSPSTFCLMASWAGLSYDQLLSGILQLARQR